MAQTTGYDKLSVYMADDKYAIFRRFKLSANRDLLYLQAELAQLETELTALSSRDQSGKGEERLYGTNWSILSTSETRGESGEQWKKVLQIREKTREYCKRSRSQSKANRC